MISPLPVRGRLDRAAGPEELAAAGRQVDLAVDRLVRAGNPAGMVTRFLASVHDGLYGGPPATPRRPWGRRRAVCPAGAGQRRPPESTLRTDQDHALVLADDPPPGAGACFAALAEQLAAILERCGLPRCPGDVMATNPAWRAPLGV